jgi:glutamine synthetase
MQKQQTRSGADLPGVATAQTEDWALPEEIHTVELVVPDGAGLLRGKRVPRSMWRRVAKGGIALAGVIFEWSPCCDIREDAPYSNMENGVPDVRIVPMLETLRVLPWQDGTARVLCEALEPDGSPVRVDPRRALQAVLARYARLGYQVKAGVEFEFYLLDPETRRPRQTATQCYGVAHAPLYEGVLSAIRNLLDEYGIPIEASNLEYAPGQVEVNLLYGDALEAADASVQFRSAVKEIAAREGWLASFMAKPFQEESGSGMHVHYSLWEGESNVFAEGPALSELGNHFLGGLQRHMPSITLFGSPTANGMKRRVDHSFCPTTASWGGDNRTVGLRVIDGEEEATRIEQRDGAADCNPYLAMAAQLAAGIDGIEKRTQPSPRCEGDAYTPGGHALLPRTVPEAIAALSDSELAAETFDPMLLETFVGFCRYEHDTVTGAVTELERQRYLEAF